MSGYEKKRTTNPSRYTRADLAPRDTNSSPGIRTGKMCIQVIGQTNNIDAVYNAKSLSRFGLRLWTVNVAIRSNKDSDIIIGSFSHALDSNNGFVSLVDSKSGVTNPVKDELSINPAHSEMFLCTTTL